MGQKIMVTLTSHDRDQWIDIRHFCKLMGYQLIETIDVRFFSKTGKFSFKIPKKDMHIVQMFIESFGSWGRYK